MVTQTYMYKCELCKQVISSHTKAIRSAVKTRPRQYPNHTKEVSVGKGKTKVITVPGGLGHEIVHETVACPACAANFHKQSEETAATV